MKRSCSAGERRSRPRPACSLRECSVSTPTFSPRSGCARISASLAVLRRGVHRGAQRGVEVVEAREARLPGVLRDPRRVLVERAEARDERSRSSAICPSTASGTSSNASTSTSPRSVIFSDGITESARNESVMNGASIVTPCSASRSCSASRPSATCSSGASESSPAIGSASSPRTSPSRATTSPAAERLRARRAQRHVAVVHADHDEVVRVVGDGRRERAASSPKPRTSPRPTRPVPWWRSITAIFARSRAGSATISPSRTSGASTPWPVISWPGSISITRTRAGAPGIPNETGTERIVSRSSAGARRGTRARVRP